MYDLEKLHQLHRAGQLDEARVGYQAILKKNPREIKAIHALGIIFAQQENYSKAIEYLEKAIHLQPHDPNLFLHLANVLKTQGLFTQAAQALQKTIELHPNYVPAINNLGTVYYSQGKVDEAIHYYQLAIEKEPAYVDAYYNLGLALGKKERLADAIFAYEKLLTLAPEHFAARFHLACALLRHEKIEEALTQFLNIEKNQPYHFETQTNLATCYLRLGKLSIAKHHYLKALELIPNDTQVLFNLGYINMQQGHLDSAIQNYQRAVQINPDFFAAHNNLGVAFIAKQHASLALQHFREALRLQPNNMALQYTVNALEKHQHLLAAPPDYVRSLFDAYADHYEPHLLQALDYQVPQLLQQAVANHLSTSLDIVDLGCGTGLCGMVFKPYAKQLTGVDISEKMLAVAAKKNIYQELICSDIQPFLAEKKSQYDLIIAGDVLVYFGNLSTLFQQIHHALREKGLFIFNAEINEKVDFQMNQSGRFSHHKNYLDQLACENLFTLLHYDVGITRLQNNEPVQGHLYVLRK